MELYLNYFSQDLYEFIFAQIGPLVEHECRRSCGGRTVFWRASSKARTRQDFLSEKFPMMSASIPEQK